jgi:hypothetical protein
MAIAWNFSGLAFILLMENQLIKVTLSSIEDWKKALDQNKYVAAILMDLSKAFDCLPHDLLILKLKTYGVSPFDLKPFSSLQLPLIKQFGIRSLSEKQIKNSDLYNYADDNTLSYSDHDIKKVISTLEDDSVQTL